MGVSLKKSRHVPINSIFCKTKQHVPNKLSPLFLCGPCLSALALRLYMFTSLLMLLIMSMSVHVGVYHCRPSWRNANNTWNRGWGVGTGRRDRHTMHPPFFMKFVYFLVLAAGLGRLGTPPLDNPLPFPLRSLPLPFRPFPPRPFKVPT